MNYITEKHRKGIPKEQSYLVSFFLLSQKNPFQKILLQNQCQMA